MSNLHYYNLVIHMCNILIFDIGWIQKHMLISNFIHKSTSYHWTRDNITLTPRSINLLAHNTPNILRAMMSHKQFYDILVPVNQTARIRTFLPLHLPPQTSRTSYFKPGAHACALPHICSSQTRETLARDLLALFNAHPENSFPQ